MHLKCEHNRSTSLTVLNTKHDDLNETVPYALEYLTVWSHVVALFGEIQEM